LWVARFVDKGVGVPGICVRKGSVIRYRRQWEIGLANR
jgi:hypothetical protein